MYAFTHKFRVHILQKHTVDTDRCVCLHASTPARHSDYRCTCAHVIAFVGTASNRRHVAKPSCRTHSGSAQATCGHLLAAAHAHHVAPTRCSTQPIARRCTCLQREENDQLVDAPARELRMFHQQASKTHRRPEGPAVARQRKIEIEEDAVGAQPGDTNSTALQPSIMREKVGHALDTVITRSQEAHQAVIMHHGPADEVVVAGAPNTLFLASTVSALHRNAHIWNASHPLLVTYYCRVTVY